MLDFLSRFIAFRPQNPNLLAFVAPFAVAWLLGMIGTWLSIRLARTLGALDHPVERSSHAAPTPRLGGLGVALGLFGALLALAYCFPGLTVFDPRSDPAFFRALLAGGILAFALGLADDVRALPPMIKLAGQILCAAAAVCCGISFAGIGLPFGATIALGRLGPLVTMAWIIFFMNAFNFMDGLDGQTAGFGATASAGLALPMLLGLNRDPGWALRAGSLVLLAGALLGFARFNVSRPARTFMGDSGSQMAGYALALALASARPEHVAPGLLALWPFVYDVSYTLAQRAARRQNLFQAHHDHLYQRLLKTGLSHRSVLRRNTAFDLVCLAASAYYVVEGLRAQAAPLQLGCLGVVLAATAAYTASVWRRERARSSGG